MTNNRGVTSRRSFIVGTCTAAVLSADTDLALITLAAASGRVRKRTISPVELTEACLRRIERLNPSLNAYITVTSEAALTQARGFHRKTPKWSGG